MTTSSVEKELLIFFYTSVVLVTSVLVQIMDCSCRRDFCLSRSYSISQTTVKEERFKTETLISAGNSKAKVTVLLATFAGIRKDETFHCLGERFSSDRDVIISVPMNCCWMTKITTDTFCRLHHVWGVFTFSGRFLVRDIFQCDLLFK